MTPTLGDLFPSDLKADYIDRSISPGSVFRLISPHTNPPKIKIFVILAVTEDTFCVGILYINTDINVNLFPTPSLRALHNPLKAKDWEFLDHDSYLDCSQIYELSFDQLKEKFKTDSDCYLGELEGDDFEQSVELVKSARTISLRDKRKFGLVE